MINGERETRTFKSKEDVWDVVDILVQETQDFNDAEGKDFDISTSVMNQIPFFACPNIFFDPSIHKDIERFIYCEKFGIPPYSGSFGEQPHKWVARSFAIRKALAKKEKVTMNAMKKGQK